MNALVVYAVNLMQLHMTMYGMKVSKKFCVSGSERNTNRSTQ